MALIKCEKCGELISDKAKKCPICEKKRELFSENIRVYGFVILVMIAITIPIMLILFILCLIFS